jgi:biopolymer transport protein ExbB
MDFLEKGGHVMLIIIACSFVAVTVMIERWRFYRKVEKQGVRFLPIAGSRDAGTLQDEIISSVMLRLEQYLYILVTIATIAPLLGLLGTVLGMIKTFHAASLSGVGDPRLLAEGISEALYNTAGGLCVTVPCIIANNYFRAWAERILESLARKPQEIAEVVERGEELGNEV